MRARVVEDGQGGFYGIRIECPGCGGAHVLSTDWTAPGMDRAPADGRHVWQFNGNLARPTLAPSLLMRRGHHVDGTPADQCCICSNAKEKGKPTLCGVCHSFVADGRIQFLNDCTHALAGQTVDLPEIE